MKHKLSVTLILLGMFIITQFIGLYVVNYYSDGGNDLPYGMEPPEMEQEQEYYSVFSSILVAFIIAVALFFLLTRFNIQVVLKIWFCLVVAFALAVTFNSIFPDFPNVVYWILFLTIPLAIIKTFYRNIFVHNFTELFIYPGIAAIFIPLLNIWTMIAFLILISAYDIWAVRRSKIMQKMAKYQMNELKIFSGFFIPYLSKKVREKIKKMKKSKKGEKSLKKKKFSANVAILGGGDVVFPIISAGVMLKTFGIWAAVLTILGAFLGLIYLLSISKKKKFYPAMPFISVGIFLAMAISWIIF